MHVLVVKIPADIASTYLFDGMFDRTFDAWQWRQLRGDLDQPARICRVRDMQPRRVRHIQAMALNIWAVNKYAMPM